MNLSNVLRGLFVAAVPSILAIALLSGGCSDTVACSNDKNCAPGYSCIDNACEPSSGATPTS